MAPGTGYRNAWGRLAEQGHGGREGTDRRSALLLDKHARTLVVFVLLYDPLCLDVCIIYLVYIFLYLDVYIEIYMICLDATFPYRGTRIGAATAIYTYTSTSLSARASSSSPLL